MLFEYRQDRPCWHKKVGRFAMGGATVLPGSPAPKPRPLSPWRATASHNLCGGRRDGFAAPHTASLSAPVPHNTLRPAILPPNPPNVLPLPFTNNYAARTVLLFPFFLWVVWLRVAVCLLVLDFPSARLYLDRLFVSLHCSLYKYTFLKFSSFQSRQSAGRH